MNGRILTAARAVLAVGFVIAPFATNSALAQVPTPEGTDIINIAVVNWTDANGNSYVPDSASVTVTVGFGAGIDVAAGAATVTPASPTTGATITFDIDNIGNGSDSVTVAENISVGGIITVTAGGNRNIDGRG
jgi:hypothetical protein